MSQVCGPIWIMRKRLTRSNRHKNPMKGLPIIVTDGTSISRRRVWPLEPLWAQRAFCTPPCGYYYSASINAFVLLLFHPLRCSFTYSVILCAALCCWILMLSMLMRLAPAEVEQAPPLNANLLPHLHTLKCQIPPQIIAAAVERWGLRPRSDSAQTVRSHRMHGIKSTSKPV